MSIIFGVQHAAGTVASKENLLVLGKRTARWAREGSRVLYRGRIGMGVQPYSTHLRSTLEHGPIFDELGNMLALDGRLDNHEDLRTELGIDDAGTSDAHIILAAFRRWGGESFARLIGDWAVAVWCEADQSLSLARDHAGTRSLYFEERAGSLHWSTYLETFFEGEEPRELDRDYVASYLRSRTIGDRTPYAKITAVTPGHVITFRKATREVAPHWRCRATSTLHYADDRAYEEHFLALLKQAVGRRTVPGAPILAHLSGGMDSSTIVCVADLLRSIGGTERDLLDTVSFFDDSEPSWDERPYFTAVEAYRGKIGLHVDVAEVRPNFDLPALSGIGWSLLPGLDPNVQAHTDRFESRLSDHGYRAILSGLGGDEFLGGVPTPLPELSDHLVRGHFPRLFRRAIEWCFSQRKPLGGLLWETLRFSMTAYGGEHFPSAPPPWVPRGVTSLRSRGRATTSRCLRWARWPTPSAIATEHTWWTLLETIPNPQLQLWERREYRFPYLDRDLLEFLLRVPSDQHVRPGRRRSLMRRALKGIVPESVLERRRKGYLARSPMYTVVLGQERIREIMADSVLARKGYIDGHVFEACLRKAVLGVESRWASALTRTCLLELWLRSGSRSLPD